MSKLIVEMEMPKTCAECPISDFFHKPCAMRNDETAGYDQFHAYKKNERPAWCPIKGELPDEHGDLIDRDVSIQTFKCIEEAPYSGFDGQEAFYTPEDVVNNLLCQDVVIAAERRDDEH